jgi:hypothetical protein
MKAVFLPTCALLLAASLGGCAANRAAADNRAGVDVTRTHLGQQVARGQIAIEPANPALASSAGYRDYAGAVAAELSRLGWTVVNTVGTSEQVALVDTRGPGNQLSVRIKRRSDGTVFWEGRAANPSGGAAPAGGAMLASALFRDFPGESGRTIRVR